MLEAMKKVYIPGVDEPGEIRAKDCSGAPKCHDPPSDGYMINQKIKTN